MILIRLDGKRIEISMEAEYLNTQEPISRDWLIIIILAMKIKQTRDNWYLNFQTSRKIHSSFSNTWLNTFCYDFERNEWLNYRAHGCFCKNIYRHESSAKALYRSAMR